MYTKGVFALINTVLFLNIQVCNSQNQIFYHSSFEEEIFKSVIAGKFKDTLGFMLASNIENDQLSRETAEKELLEMIQPLQKRVNKGANEMVTLKKLNRKIAANYLKNYKKLSDFSDLIDEGTFDCLTSTLLYAYLLEKLGYKYNIKETNYHIYLVVNLEKKDVLIEPTDPNYGFIWEKKYVDKRIAKYRADNIKGKDDFLASVDIDRKINLFQLAGLQYYNLAVKQFNKQEFNQSINSLKKSMIVYDCDRNRILMDYSLEFMREVSSLK